MQRINFRLSKELLDKFHNASLKAGIPKSALLRDWISEVNIEDLYQIRSKKEGIEMTSYNFVIDNTFNELLKHKSDEAGMDISELLRKIISSKFIEQGSIIRSSQVITSINHLKVIEHYRYKGMYKNMVDYIDDRNLYRSDNSRFSMNLAEAYTEIGDFKKATDVVKHINDRENKDVKSKILFDLLMLDIYIFTSNFALVREVENTYFNSNLNMHLTREVVGKMSLKLGFYYLVADNIGMSSKYLENAFMYLDIENYPNEIALIYLYYSILYSYKLDWKNSEEASNKAKNIFLKLGNVNGMVKVYHMKSVNAFRCGYLAYSKENTIKMQKVPQKYFTPRENLYIFDDLARIDLIEGKYDDALVKFQKTDLLSKSIGYNHYCAPKTYIDLINSRKGEVMFKPEESENLDNYTHRQNLRRYAYFASNFLYSGDSLNRNIGLLGLKKLSTHKDYPIAAEAAKKTLETKQLQYVR